MTKRIPGLIARYWLGFALAMLLVACGKEDGERILGHWRAEQMQLQGLGVPMGPEFVVSPSELRSPDGAIHIPLSSISAEGETVTLNLPLGLGLTFKFESKDRISFEMPLFAGRRIYYQRVNMAQTGQTTSRP